MSSNGRRRVFALERHGLDPIPEDRRTLSLRGLFDTWVGSNLSPLTVSLGVFIYALGLPVLAGFVAVFIGCCGFALAGIGAVAGTRTGLPNQRLSERTFGPTNRINALLSWLLTMTFQVFNLVAAALAASALFDLSGVGSGDSWRFAAVTTVFAVTALFSVYGHAVVVWAQKPLGIALGICALLMLATTLGDVTPTTASAETSGDLRAWTIAVGLVFASTLGYVLVPADFSRYLPSATPARSIVRATVAGCLIPNLGLMGVGILLAATGDVAALGADPIGGTRSLLPGWLYVAWCVVALAGCVANNSVIAYSSGLSAQTAGLPLRRWQATLVDATVAFTGTCFILFGGRGDLLDWLTVAVSTSVVWLGPYAAVWISDLLLANRRHAPISDGPVADRRMAAWAAMASGTVSAVPFLSHSKWTGPAAEALGSIDLAWCVGPAVGAIVYVAANAVVERRTAGPA
ncbi:MAG: purine-cytosine permease family protein [Acidimicrobiales bacterium]